mmetsp:Transcript_29746/g.62091  ORF Transcript_29746/g.62091 Transcript_29746/m.62091 type:complete len:100 (-) Transcript_29746:93-392(-)
MGAIAMETNHNIQGGSLFSKFDTGRTLSISKFYHTLLPTLDDATADVDYMYKGRFVDDNAQDENAKLEMIEPDETSGCYCSNCIIWPSAHAGARAPWHI